MCVGGRVFKLGGLGEGGVGGAPVDSDGRAHLHGARSIYKGTRSRAENIYRSTYTQTRSERRNRVQVPARLFRLLRKWKARPPPSFLPHHRLPVCSPCSHSYGSSVFFFLCLGLISHSPRCAPSPTQIPKLLRCVTEGKPVSAGMRVSRISQGGIQ